MNHFNIVQIHDYGRDADGPFLILEFVDGPTLEARLKDSPLELEEAVEIACQLCDALNKAHGEGVIRLNPEHAKAYINRASAYFDKREYDLAIKDCTEAIRLKPNLAEPNLAEAYGRRGSAYGNKGEVDLAIKNLTAAIRLNPDDVTTKLNLKAVKTMKAKK